MNNPAVYPSNIGFENHFKEFVVSGYISSRESIETKFPYTDSTRAIKDCSVGCVDGYTKVLCMVGIIACCSDLDPLLKIDGKFWISFGAVSVCHQTHWLVWIISPSWHGSQDFGDEQCGDAGLKKCLESLLWVRCSYTHFESPTYHYLHSLRDFEQVIVISFWLNPPKDWFNGSL